MIRRLLHSGWFTIGGIAVLIALVFVFARRTPELVAVNREMRHIQENVDQVSRQQEALKDKEAYYQSDAFLEQQARIQLNYKKPGEQVVYIYHTVSQQQEVITSPKPLTNLKLWWYYLIGKK